jgi:hypothetical protein
VSEERREYFRINDTIYLKLRVLGEDEAQQPLEEKASGDGGSDNLTLTLQSLADQSGNLLVGIRKSQPDIAHYLSLLEKRIELISRVVVGDHLGKSIEPNTPVSLSAGGISFNSEQSLAPETPLAMEIILFPSHLHIQAIGRVAYCKPNREKSTQGYSLGIDFIQISDIAREALVKHTLELQSARLRAGKRELL